MSYTVSALISIWGDVSVKSKVEGKMCSNKQESTNTYIISFVCHLFHIAVSSYWYQMHPRIDWDSNPRTSDISSDSELSVKVCMNVAKHTHSATYKFTALFH